MFGFPVPDVYGYSWSFPSRNPVAGEGRARLELRHDIECAMEPDAAVRK